MKQIKPTMFKEAGKTIVFRQPPDADPDSLYYFKVIDDPELTKKLRKAVKRTEVPESSIAICAESLFAMIRTNDLEPLKKREEIKALMIKFSEVFSEDPEFEIKDLSNAEERTSLFSAQITNIISVPCDVKTARTAGNAKFYATKACLEAAGITAED